MTNWKAINGILLFLTISFCSLGQNYAEEDELLSQLGGTSYGILSAIEEESIAIIQQQGIQNAAQLFQTGTDQRASIRQSGTGNYALVAMEGRFNASDVFQFGVGNATESQLTGSNNSSFIWQQGNGNSVKQEIVGNNRQYEIYQIGNSNELIQIDRGGPSLDYSVTQRGNGMKVIIESGL